MRTWAMAVILMGLTVADAGAATRQNIDGAVPMFCLDDHDTYQPLVRTDYARVRQAYTREFGWEHGLFSTTPTLGRLVFSQNGKTTDPETITYDVEPHDGGIALLHMHVRLGSTREDLSVTAMCWRTFGIVNHHLDR